MKAGLIVSAIVSAILTLPPFAFGTLDGTQAGIAGVYSFAAAFIVMMFAPQLARFVAPANA